MIPNHIFDWLINIEGGDKYTNDPLDFGGETKYGISKRAHPDLDIKNLTYEKAKHVYEVEYWRPAHCSSLPKYMQLMQFNAAVNCGVDTASRLLQRTIGAKVDGKVGPKTLRRISQYGDRPKMFTINYSSWLLMYYLQVIIRRSSQTKWARGWFRRTADAIYTTAFNQGKQS